jgi:hypothetical protein
MVKDVAKGAHLMLPTGDGFRARSLGPETAFFRAQSVLSDGM